MLQAILTPASGHGASARTEARSPATTLVTQYILQRGAQSDQSSHAPIQCTWKPRHDSVSINSVELLQEQLKQVQRERDEMAQQLGGMSKQIDMLTEAVQKMQMGLSRHHSEKLDPGQLKLALGLDEQDQDQDQPDKPSSAKDKPSDDSKPEKKIPKRDSHGRGKNKALPKVFAVLIPDEITSEGLKNFDLIGYEESSSLVYRRGGLIEFITRRAKFVPISPSKLDKSTSAPPHSQPAKSSTPRLCVPSGVVRTEDGSPAFTEQLVRMTLPSDTATSHHNIFVDGALVRYRPDGNKATRAGPVLIAPMPIAPIDKGLADASLLAHLFVEKHVMHLPYYRQENRLERHGHGISRTNMSRWQLECGQLIEPLIKQMWSEAVDRPWFAMDATSTALQASPKLIRGYVHVLVSESHSVLYRFTEQNNAATLVQLFGEAHGTILADSSSTHNGLFGDGKAKHAGCWAHARRHFVQAFKANEGAEAAHVLQRLQKLFRIEARARDMSPGERLAERILYARPIVDELIDLADRCYEDAPPDTYTRSGFVYLHNQAAPLRQFLSDGEVPMHNNVSERALRRMVKGRINWLFHGSPKHARAACNIASVAASAEHIGLDPELYIQEILTVLPAWPVRRVLELAPENWLATRARLLEQGSLTYIDIAMITGNMLRFPSKTPSTSLS